MFCVETPSVQLNKIKEEKVLAVKRKASDLLKMLIEISSSLKLISNALNERTESKRNRDHFEIAELLKTLNTKEKYLIADFFCKLPWNIGSLRVLALLHELRILTATEYILSCEKTEEIQLILNDFLEADFELITNLFINSTCESDYSVRLNNILDESLENLFKDLIERPELNNLDFFQYIKINVPGEILSKIIIKTLGIIQTLHQSSIKDAFANFSTWINEGVDDIKLPKDLCEKLLHNSIEDALNFMFKQSSEEAFKDWKFYIIMLQTICSIFNAKAGPIVRKYLKIRIKQCANVPCKQTMLHILLTARAANATTIDIAKNIGNYADWYKQNIGEMKFYLKVDEFQNMLSMLDQCIAFEMDRDYLELHAAISISPPVLCGKLVQAYKSKCKQRLQQIKKGFLDEEAAVNEKIIIEDSN